MLQVRLDNTTLLHDVTSKAWMVNFQKSNHERSLDLMSPNVTCYRAVHNFD